MMDTEALIARFAAEGAKKPLPHPLAIAGKWLALLAVYFVIVTLVTGFRPDLATKWTQAFYLLELVGMLATGITAAIAASFLALPDVGGRPWVKFVPLIPIMMLGLLLMESIASGNAMPLIECIQMQRYDCLARIALFSLVPAAVMFVAIQRAAPTRCCWAGSMAGLSTASFGYVLLRLVDTADDPSALVIWHLIPVMLVTMVGMVAGKFYFRNSALA